MMKNQKKPELLMPAGDLNTLRIAFHYGADAVYIGGEEYGLRAKAKNFNRSDMEQGIRYAHELGRKVYVTVNIFAHNEDLPGVREYLKELSEIGPDALIISDPGVFSLARDLCPGIDLHISTQANNTNYETCRFWASLGATRIVTARELSLEELKELKGALPEGPELETFIHGAMCISYSGRCLISNYFTGRDSNRGECTHPCRWKYFVTEETRPGEFLPLEENDRGTFLFNSRDLCMIRFVPELLKAGIDSFKIEGRMKTALYVGTVARVYREAIDLSAENEAAFFEKLPAYEEELTLCTHRPYGTGFFFGKPDSGQQIYGESSYEKGAVYLGFSEEVYPDGSFLLTQKNKFSLGETLEILKPGGENVTARVERILDMDGTEMDSAPHAKQILRVKLSKAPEPLDVIRRREE